MFGFFKKKETKAPVPPNRPMTPEHEAYLLEVAIAKLHCGDEKVLPVFFEALSKRTVTVLLQKPNDIRTCLVLQIGDTPMVAVFTKPQLTEEWRVQGYEHLMDIPMPQLCARIVDDAVGLTINPDCSIFGFPLSPELFRHFREVLAASRPPFKEGGIYSVCNDDGTFSVLKILKLDDGGVHIRTYSNAWPAPPTAVDESALFMRSFDRKPDEKLGMGHMPISKKSFPGWNCAFVQQSTVLEDELEGYRMWLEGKGGYFI